MKMKLLVILLVFLSLSGCSFFTFQSEDQELPVESTQISENTTIQELTPTAEVPVVDEQTVLEEIYFLQSGTCVVEAVNPKTAEVRTVTTAPPAFDCWRPQFSPDGSKLAFVSMDGNYDLYVMNLDGSGLTQLTQAIAFTWSPDGTQIIYQTYSVEKDKGQLWVVDVQSAEAHLAGFEDVSICTSCSADLNLAWSPTGDWVYSPADLGYPDDITIQGVIFNTDTEEIQMVFQNELPFWNQAQWASDGSKLAVVVPGTEEYGCMDLLIADTKGQSTIISGRGAFKSGEEGPTASCFSSTAMAWSKDASYILLSGNPQGIFADGKVQYDRIFRVDPKTGDIHLMEYWQGHPGAFYWSPDTTQFAFISTSSFSDPEGVDGPLYIMTNDADNAHSVMLVEKVKNSPHALYWIGQ
jgi:dipeptidyl aminopeptidase/acylaminoacyl peptidase